MKMLMCGNSRNIINSGNIFNITSYIEGYIRLNFLIPPNSLGQFVDRDFDIAYMNYIFTNDVVFKQFFDIIYCLYLGQDVYLIKDDSDWSENIIESLLKLIQQRYGYNYIEINSYDDYIQAFNSSFISDFNSEYGLINLDNDRERYTYMIESNRINNGGAIIYDD